MIMFTSEKLAELEKTIQEHLMAADNHHQFESHKPFWQYYRQDLPNCLLALREYKEILKQIEADKKQLEEAGDSK